MAQIYYHTHIIKQPTISCNYLKRLTKPVTNEPYDHLGIDLPLAKGKPIPAAADGTVYKSYNEEGGYGHNIVLEHQDRAGQKVYTIYAQMMEKSPLSIGQEVKKNDIIGYVGATGNATDNHVHFEIRTVAYTGPSRKNTNPALYDLSQLSSKNATAQTNKTSKTSKTGDNKTNGKNSGDTANTNEKPAIDPICTPKACVEDEFIVQIVGKDHPAGQRIILLDGNNKLEFNSEEQIKSSTYSLLSTLKKWDWNKLSSKASTLKAYLEIDTEGAPIRLLLSDQIKKTEKQLDKQHNQITPIVPLTPLYGSNYIKNGSDFDKEPYEPVHVREGWFYIFKNNKVWREIKIVKEDAGYIYQDVQLKDYYKDGKFTQDKRKASGAALQEIWIPTCWNEADITDNNFFYSEVQLSKERLNYLEKNNERANNVSMQITADNFEKIVKGIQLTNDNLAAIAITLGVTRKDTSSTIYQGILDNKKNLINHAFPLDITPPQRSRFDMYEYIFDHPSKYLRDLSGKFPSKCLEEAREYVKIYTDKKNSYPQIYDKTVQATNHRRLPYSQVAVGIALEETLVPKRAKAAAKANPKADIATQQANAEKKLNELIKICQAAAQEQDILEDARDRKIVGVMVEDPLYRLRQLQSQLNASQNTVNLAAELATYQTNHGSAVLVENLIKPRSINGRENGLSKIYEEVKSRLDTHAIDYATAAGIRAQAKSAHSFALKRFITEYKKESNHAVLADLCSLNGFDYSGALYFIAKLATTLATQQFDPILIEMSQGKHSKTAIKTLIDTLDNEKHRLATFIWKRTTQSDDLTKPYKDQPLEENKGDGICRPTELIRLQKLQATQVMADTQFLESKLLADFATKESSSRTGAKAVGSAVLEVYSKIVESLSSAQTAYYQSRAAVIETAGAIRTNTSAQSQNQQGIDNNQQQQQTNRTQGQEIENRQTQVATEMNGIPEERARLETERGEMGEISEEARNQENTTRRQGNQRIGQAMDEAQQAGRNAATTRTGVLAQGRQAVMNIYERAGGQLRQVHADFYPLILERTGNVNIRDYFVLLWDNMDELRPQLLRNVNGRLTTPDGTTMAVTNLQEAQANGFTPAKSNQRLWMIPRNTSTENLIIEYFVTEETAVRARNAASDVVADALRQVNAWSLLAQEADNEVANINQNLRALDAREAHLQAERARYQEQHRQNQINAETLEENYRQLEAERASLTAERTQLQTEHQAQIQARDAARQELAARNQVASRTGVLPALVLALETYNLFMETSNVFSTMEQKGVIRGFGTLLSANLDFYIAVDALTERIRNAQAGRVLVYYGTSVEYLATKLGPDSLIMTLLPSLTIRLLAQVVTSGVFGVLSLLDFYDAGRAGNPAAWGYLMIAAGCAVSLVSGVMAAMTAEAVSAVAAASALGPAGWAALILIVAGAAWIAYFNRGDIETWLLFGPFGIPDTGGWKEALQSDTAYNYLKDEADAYYFLLSLLSNSKVVVKPNELQQQAKAKIAKLKENGGVIEEGLQKLADANVQVDVNSGFAGLVIEAELHKTIRAKFIQHETQSSFTPNMSSRQVTSTKMVVLNESVDYLLQETSITGTTYYYQIDSLDTKLLSSDVFNTRNYRTYALPVRVQLAMNIVAAAGKAGATDTANTQSKTNTEAGNKNKPTGITQYQWFFPAPTLAEERKPQPTNKEPKFILGEDEDYWLRDPIQEQVSAN